MATPCPPGHLGHPQQQQPRFFSQVIFQPASTTSPPTRRSPPRPRPAPSSSSAVPPASHPAPPHRSAGDRLAGQDPRRPVTIQPNPALQAKAPPLSTYVPRKGKPPPRPRLLSADPYLRGLSSTQKDSFFFTLHRFSPPNFELLRLRTSGRPPLPSAGTDHPNRTRAAWSKLCRCRVWV